jgi:hypothetical protein
MLVTIVFSGTGRELKNIIKKRLYSGMIQEAYRTQYVKRYKLGQGKSIVQQEVKQLVIRCERVQYDLILADVVRNDNLEVLSTIEDSQIL